MDGVDAALAELIACGTAVVGDINTLVTFEPPSRSDLPPSCSTS